MALILKDSNGYPMSMFGPHHRERLENQIKYEWANYNRRQVPFGIPVQGSVKDHKFSVN